MSVLNIMKKQIVLGICFFLEGGGGDEKAKGVKNAKIGLKSPGRGIF